MADMASVVKQTYDQMGKLAAQQQQYNDAARVFLAQFGPPSVDAVNRLSKAMQQFVQKDAKKFEENLNKLKSAATGVSIGLAASTASLLKFQHSANPQLFGAFNTQLETLQAKLGNALLPLFSELMDGVADVIEWFDGLTETNKKLVAGLAVGLPLVLGFGRGLFSLGPAFAVAQAALERLRASSMAMAASGGVAGGVAALAGIVMLVNQLGEQKTAERRDLLAHTGPVNEKELETAGLSREQREKLIAGGEDAEAVRAEMRAKAKELRDRLAENSWKDRMAQKAVGAQDYMKARADALESVAGRTEKEGPVVSHEEMTWNKKVARLNQKVVAAGREQAPHYSGLADVHKQIQLGVLGKNPYEQELLKTNREQLKVLRDLLKKEIENGRGAGYHIRGQ